MRRHVEQSFGEGVAPRLKRALELAVRGAGGRPLSPSDVLVGIASVGDSPAARILADHGLTLAGARAELAEALR